MAYPSASQAPHIRRVAAEPPPSVLLLPEKCVSNIPPRIHAFREFFYAVPGPPLIALPDRVSVLADGASEGNTATIPPPSEAKEKPLEAFQGFKMIGP